MIKAEMELQELYEAFRECTEVTTDSRTVKGGELFFALKGENFDGNEYALTALDAGARYAVVDSGSEAASTEDPRLIRVSDTLEALQSLARLHRHNCITDGKPLTVIGLTGTNGKTTTKELMTRVLSKKYRVCSTRGNLNNDIGVPLSILAIEPGTQIAVIEMGASHPGDIETLVRIADPDYGLVTNVGKAHLLGFSSFEGVKKTKGELYDHIWKKDGFIFINADDPELMKMAAERKGLKTIPFGLEHWGAVVLPSTPAHPFVTLALPENLGSSAGETPAYSETLLALESRLVGSYNASNIAAAIAVGLHFGVTLEDAMLAVSEYVPVNNRSQLVRTERNVLIVDAYNANPTSMAAALENLASTEASRKAALLGDMRELGQESVSEHLAVLEKALVMGLDLLCLVGEEFRKAASGLCTAANVRCFPDSESLADWLRSDPLEGATVLVKGSRGVRMEKVLPEL